MVEPLGAVQVEGDQAAIVIGRYLPFSSERVWEALTEADQLCIWFGKAEVTPGLGGVFVLEAGPENVPCSAAPKAKSSFGASPRAGV